MMHVLYAYPLTGTRLMVQFGHAAALALTLTTTGPRQCTHAVELPDAVSKAFASSAV